MIVGIGIDMIEVDRVSEKVAKGIAFVEQVFSNAEIAYCESQANKGQSYAARFAAKEAFLKATGLGLLKSYELNNIEILNDQNGKPEILLHGEFKVLAEKHNWKKIHVSLSHLSLLATAMVIIEG